jgi:hypothetical protein
MWQFYLRDKMFYNNTSNDNNLLVEFQIHSFFVTGKTRTLPLHIHYISNDCSLSVLFIKTVKVKFNLEQIMKTQRVIYDYLKGSCLSVLFRAFQTYIPPHSGTPATSVLLS